MKAAVRYEPVLDAKGNPLLNEDGQPITRAVLCDPMTSMMLNADKIADVAQDFLAHFEKLIEERTLWHTSIARASHRLRTFCKERSIASFAALAATSATTMLRTPNIGWKTVKEAHFLCVDRGLELLHYAEWNEHRRQYPKGWTPPEPQSNETPEPK